MYKRLTFTKVDENKLQAFLNKMEINMKVASRHNLTTISGNLTNSQYKDLLKGISALKHNQSYISKNMAKVQF